MTHVGRPVAHESARGHVTGEALYTDDLAGRFSRLVHAHPVTSPHAHARVVRIDPAPALACAGVVRVLGAADVPGENDTGCVRHDEPLFPGVAVHEGQPVAWVLAEGEEEARRGASAVRVQWEERPAVLGIDAAIEAGSFHTEPLCIARGDVGAALAAAPHRLRGELRTGAQEHFYLETQASIAVVDEAENVLVHASTQHPSETQEVCARVLGLPKSRVVCQSLRMGGAFGGKESQANPCAAVAALGAYLTRRPVRVRLDRQRDMALTGKRHPFLARYEVGFEADGRLVALALELFADGGHSLDLSAPVLSRAMFHADNAYLLPAARVTGRVCRTNHVSHTAFRGFGGPQGVVVIEEVMDRIARHLGLPGDVVRERCFYREGDAAHYGQEIRDAGRIAQIWSDLKEEARFDERRSELVRFNAKSPDTKRGLAITPVKFGISFTTSFLNQAGALVLVYKDGSVHVSHGGTEMGQGLHTKVRQIAADALGVPLATVVMMPTRTDKVPNTSATAASSGSDMNGAAVQAACDALRGRLARVAAARLGVAPETLRFEEGRVSVAGATAPLSFADVAMAAYLERVPLFEGGFYATPGLHYDEAAGRGKPFHYYAYGAAVSEVEVDGLTGMYRVRRVDVLHDVGDSLSPLIDRGQVEGGFMQGLGWVTCEQVVWDERGRLSTRGASTYKLPSLGECPEELHVRLLPNATEPGVVRGSKAVGEPPLMLAISVREALREAIAAFAGEPPRALPLGLPATPEAVYWAIESVRGDEREDD